MATREGKSNSPDKAVKGAHGGFILPLRQWG